MRKLFLVVAILFLFNNIFAQKVWAMSDLNTYTTLRNTGIGLLTTGVVTVAAGTAIVLVGNINGSSVISSDSTGTSTGSSTSTSGATSNSGSFNINNNTFKTAGIITFGCGVGLTAIGLGLYLVYDKKAKDFYYGFTPYVLPDINGELNMGSQFAFAYKF